MSGRSMWKTGMSWMRSHRHRHFRYHGGLLQRLADGYTGAGSRIAIIDTGLDLDHPSFDESCFLHGLELSAARFGKDMADYNLLTAEEVAEVLPKPTRQSSMPASPQGTLPLGQGSLRL